MSNEALTMYFKENVSSGMNRTSLSDFTVKGRVESILRDKDGNVKYHTVTDNLVTDVGRTLIRDLIGGSGTAPGYIALGTGTTAAANSQTALVTEITTNGGSRAAATGSNPNSTTRRFATTFTFTGNLSIQETGLFNASSAGTMISRALMANPPLNVANTDTLTQNWDITVS